MNCKRNLFTVCVAGVLVLGLLCCQREERRQLISETPPTFLQFNSAPEILESWAWNAPDYSAQEPAPLIVNFTSHSQQTALLALLPDLRTEPVASASGLASVRFVFSSSHTEYELAVEELRLYPQHSASQEILITAQELANGWRIPQNPAQQTYRVFAKTRLKFVAATTALEPLTAPRPWGAFEEANIVIRAWLGKLFVDLMH